MRPCAYFPIVHFFLCMLARMTTTAGAQDGSFAGNHGVLRVSGNRIVDREGRPVVLRGMSLFWSQWIGKYYNADFIRWLRDDWRVNAVQAAMAVEHEGYL